MAVNSCFYVILMLLGVKWWFGVTQIEMCQQVRSLSQRDMVHAALSQR